jgi:hypothetical protein
MTTNRREFLKTSAVASGVAVLGMYVPGMGGNELKLRVPCIPLTCGYTLQMTTPLRFSRTCQRWARACTLRCLC